MTKRDYYEILGLEKGASVDEVKKAYKRLAKKYHPDVSSEQNAEEKFKEVLEAYNVLSDPQKKQNYDRFGHAAEGFQGGFGFGDFSNVEFDFGDIFGGGNGIFGDMFREAFGGRPRGPRQGEHIRYDLGITFEDAAFGTEKEIEVSKIEFCDACNGVGAKSDSDIETCPKCQGSGFETHTQRTMFGVFQTRTTCRKCNGKGEVIKNPCKKCSGKGKVKTKRKIKIKIPEGINTGNHLRVKGQGNVGDKGALPGDLFIVIFVDPHEVFKRDGIDLFCEIPVGFSEAALGTEIEVPTLKKKATIKIPEGTQTGTIFKLKGLGIKELNGNNYGDEYVKVITKTPEKLNKRQKELFEELAKIEGTKLNRKNFFDKIKKAFK